MPDPTSVNSMFGRIARRYDLANHLLSGGADLWWRSRLVAAVDRCQPADLLDLATGSGDVAFALSRKALSIKKITAMDFCQPMLDEAARKLAAAERELHAPIIFLPGDGLNLPLPDGCFDAVTISFGLRNMADRHRCLSEMRRVLRPGGRLFVLEFSQPHRWFRPIYLLYLRHLLPRIAGLVTKDQSAYIYLNETIEDFPGREALGREIMQAGFTSVQARPMTCGIVALHEAIAPQS